jgi:hypothetical protein
MSLYHVTPNVALKLRIALFVACLFLYLRERSLQAIILLTDLPAGISLSTFNTVFSSACSVWLRIGDVKDCLEVPTYYRIEEYFEFNFGA